MFLAQLQVSFVLFAILFMRGTTSVKVSIKGYNVTTIPSSVTPHSGGPTPHPRGPTAPIEGYNVTTIPWLVTPHPGGPAHVFNGSIEEVFSSARKINPNFDHDFGLDTNHTAARNTTMRNTTSLMEKRDTVNCNPNENWHSAYLNGVEQGIEYLRGVPGQPQRGPGPGSCGRVSCSYQCSIWWCNDNDSTKVLPSFNNIADGAQLIVNQCTTSDPIDHLYKFVRGQDFHSDGWNVIVRLDSSGGC